MASYIRYVRVTSCLLFNNDRIAVDLHPQLQVYSEFLLFSPSLSPIIVTF